MTTSSPSIHRARRSSVPVSVLTIMSFTAISLVPAFLYLDAPASTVWFGVLLALFIVYMHRSNIRNMIDGTEYRFRRIWIGSWFGRK